MNDQININGQLCAPLTAKHYVIGRSQQCDILLPESDAGVSRRHAILQSNGQGSWSVTDLGSTNGTYVNGSPVRDSRVLEDGDRITIGGNSITLLAPRLQPAVPVPIQEKIVIPEPASVEPASVIPRLEPVQDAAVVPPPAAFEVLVPAPVTTGFPFVSSPPVANAGEIPAPATAEISLSVPESTAPPTQELAPGTTPFDARMLPQANQAAPRGQQKVGQPAPPIPKKRVATAQSSRNAPLYDSPLMLWHLLTYGVAILMAVALFLPWLGFNVFWVQGTLSYVQFLAEGSRVGLDAFIEGVIQEPRSLILFLPLGTTGALLLAAGQALLPSARRVFVQSMFLLAGGVPGALACLWFYGKLNNANNQMMAFVPINLNGLVGIGIPLYAFASFGAIGVGMMGLALMNRRQDSGR